jgi:hypothetical protein
MGGGENYPIPRDAPPSYRSPTSLPPAYTSTTDLPPVTAGHDNLAIRRNTYDVPPELVREPVPVDRDDGNRNNTGCTGCKNCEFTFMKRVWRVM